jgi:hypothetical protein
MPRVVLAELARSQVSKSDCPALPVVKPFILSGPCGYNAPAPRRQLATKHTLFTPKNSKQRFVFDIVGIEVCAC